MNNEYFFIYLFLFVFVISFYKFILLGTFVAEPVLGDSYGLQSKNLLVVYCLKLHKIPINLTQINLVGNNFFTNGSLFLLMAFTQPINIYFTPLYIIPGV